MSYPFHNVFVAGQSSYIQGDRLLVNEQLQRDLSTGLPHLHSEPSLCSSGTTSLKSVGLAPSVTHGSENNTARLDETTTTSNFSCTSDGFHSSSAEFLGASDGKRHSGVDFDKSLFYLSSNHTSDASSKSIADLNVGGTNIVDQSNLPDLDDLAITRQAAAKILMNYGLEKEDLDELISCPAEQTTAQNLPQTLWKIRMKKAMRAATENKLPLDSEPPFPSRDYGLDALSAPEGDGTGHAPVPPNTGQSREVIDSEHIEKYTAVVDKNMDITDSAVKSGNVLQNEKFSEQPPEECRTLVKSSFLNLLVNNVDLKMNPESSLGSGSVKLLQNEPNSSLTKSKSEVSKSSLLEKLDPTVEAVPSYCPFTEIIPKPDWASMKGNAISFANGQMEIQDEVAKFTEKSMEKPPQHLLQSHIVQTVVSQVVPAYKPVSFPYFNFPATNDLPFPQSVTRPCSSVYLSPQQVLNPAKTNEKLSPEKSTAKSPPSVTMMHDFAGFTPIKFPHTCSLCKKTCSQMKEWISHKNTSLHLKNCKDLQEHSSPQNDWTFTSRNRSRSKSLGRDCSPGRSENSRLSPRRSIEQHSSPRRSRERRSSPRRSTERRSSPRRSRERCPSPMRSRERCPSPMRSIYRRPSPMRSIYRRPSPRRSRERQPSPRRSRERQPSPRRSRERCPSPMRSRERCPSPMRSIYRRPSPMRSIYRRPSPRRSRERQPSPRRSRERRPSPRRSRERRSSPRRSRERRSSPRRSRERRPSPRRSRERRCSPRRSRERRPSPRRSRERRPSPRGSKERRPLPRRIIDRQSSSSSSSSERESLPRRGIERRSSSRSSVERWFSPKRSRERRSSSRSSREQESLPRRSREQRFSSRIKEEKRLSPRLSHERSASPKRIEEGYLLKSSQSSQQKKDGKPSSLTKICKRKASLQESSSSQKKPCSLENLTERLLKAPVVQSLSGQPNVEDMVKTVIPVVLEELARMSSSSSLSSPTSLSKLIKDSSPPSGESIFSLAGSTSSPSSAVKVEKSSNMGSSPLQNKNSSPLKSKFSKPSPPTMVKLKGTFDTLCHSDLISAMDIFGKTKSVLLFKSKQEARVCFEKEEAALKLKASENFEIKGVTVTVVPEKDVVFDKPTQTSTLEQTNPELNSLDRSVTTSQMSSTGSTTVLSFKKLLSLPEKPQSITKGKPTTKATSMIVKENTGPTKKTVRCIKTKSIINKAPIESAVVKTEPSMQQEERSETEDPKREPTESSEEIVLLHKETPQTEKPADVIVTKLSREVLASKAEMASTTEQINCSATKEKLEEPAKSPTVENLPIKTPENQIKLLHPAHSKEKDVMNAKKEISNSIMEQCQPVPSEVQVETSETEDQEPIVEARDTTEAIQTKDTAASETKDHAELPEVAVEAKDVSESEQEEKARESDPKPKDEISAVDKEEKKTDPNSLPTKPNKSPPPTSTLESKPDMPSTDPRKDNRHEPPETLVKAAPAPESSGNQSVGASAEAKMNGGVEAKTHETAKIQETPASTFSSNVPTSIAASAKTQQKPRSLPKNESLLPRHHQTNIESYFTLQKINYIQSPQNVFSKHLSLGSTLVLITNLPKQHNCPYTEEEVVNVLCQFGFKYAHDKIYIFAGKCMALVLMPNRRAVTDILKAYCYNRLALGKNKLNAYVVTKNILMLPSLTDDESVVYIQEISPSEIEDLITVLKKIGSVNNYLPLVNKIFIEFETMYDTDRLGVWYSLLKRGRGHKVWRLKTPRFTSAPLPPRFPMKALPKSEEIIDGAAIVPSSDVVPPGSAPPFWVTMTTTPYVFPTVSPWFNIPAFLTVQDLDDINKASNEASAFSTVMLTGFPEGNYTQQDVAKLVEPYFSKDDPQALNHNLVILPLQRRAFVCFCSWDVCCSFIQDHIKSPVSVHGCKLQPHLVLEDLQLGSSEDLVYKTLMKWSHIYVSDLDGLEDRLLCVEISEAKLGLIKGVVTEVASAASLVNFLPLANKIWVEMVEASGVAEVMEKLCSMKESSKDQLWTKVGRIDTLKSLKQRLKDASKVPVDLMVDDGRPAGTTDVLPAASESTDAGSAEPESPGGEATAPTSTDGAAAPQKEQSGNEQPQTPGNTPGPGQIQQNTVPEPQAPVEGLKTEGGALKEEQRAAGGPAEAALEAKQTPTHEKDAAASKMQTDAASEGICSKPSASATTPLPNVFTATDDPSLTVGEKMGKLLRLYQISCLSEESIKTSKYFCIQKRLVLITNLPEFIDDDGYTEADISRLLQNFGFQYDDTHLYVIPQSRMAFALMPSCRSVQKLIRAADTQPLTLRGCQLDLHVVTSNMMMSPFGFYKSLMALIYVQVIDDGVSTIYINNISPSETRLLREALLKINSVKNYLPLLNKVFVEFESTRDADRLGVWHSLLKNCPSYSIFRLKVPRSDKTSLPPRLAARALPDRKDVVPGAVVPTTNVGVPLGSTAPFSVTMTTAPYVFPTMSPWFKIPDFVTVFGIKDTMKAKYRAFKFSTIMLTNLPEGNYSHKEVVKLVWQYFSVQNLQTLFYKVLVLPLQRRAFVCFEDWSSCCRFVQNHGSTPVSVKGNKLNLHLVLEEIQTGSSEETLFGSLMKWSNSRVPELSSLGERLLCVHISEVSVHLIILVLKTVGAIAPVVSFLPLANRICIEMAEASGVTQVVKTISDTSPVADWSKVQRVESLKSLKQRLKEQNEVKITLEMDDSSINTRPSTGKTGDQTGSSSVTTSKPPSVPAAKPAASTKGGPSGRGTKETSAASKAVKQEEQAPTSSKVSSVAGSTSDNSSQTLIKPKDGSAEPVIQEFKTPSTTQTSKTCEEHLCSAGPQTNEATPQSLEDLKSVPSKCPTAEHQSATTLKEKVQELAVQTGVANVNPKLEPQPQCSKGNAEGINVGNSESRKLGETGETEPMEVQGPTTISKDVLPGKASSASQSTKGTSPSERPTAPPQKVPNQRTEAAAPSPSPHLVHLTLGERLVKYLKPQQLIRPKRKTTKLFNQNSNVVCLSNLPKYEDHCYTEDEIVDMLRRFHVECETDNVFVFFEARVALVYLASIEKLQYFFCILAKGDLVLRGHKLEPQAIRNFIQEPVLGIYKHTMKTIRFESKLLGCRMVYIQNIPPSDSGNLIRTVKNICCVKNVLPLLNKIFIECSSPVDVDLLGVWFASLKQHQSYSVNRMGWVFSSHCSDPIKAVQSSTGDVTVIQTVEVIPVGTVPPFWITMVIEPYLFYTMSPWFKIPGFWTLNEKIDSEKYSKASQFSTIMLTGPLCSNQKEILPLVWSHFTEQNLLTLSYRVVVLPLQGRAFVFFSNWNECTRFVNSQIEKRSHSKTHNFSVHLVLEDMNPGYCEEDLYRSLMKWSNAHVTETASLEERLLCVEVTATNHDLAKTVLMLVARIAPFINALPLGNRIYIEMVDSDGAEEVLKKMNIPEFFPKNNKERILLIESLKSRKQRLKGCEGIPVNIDDPSQLTAELHPQPPAVAKGQQSSGAAVTVASAGASEPPSSSTSLDKNSKVTTEEDRGVQTATNVADVPHMDEKSFSAIKAAIHFYKEGRRKMKKDNRTSCNQTALDFSKDSLSDVSAAEEVQDPPSAESSSSSTQTSTQTKEAHSVSTKSLEVSTSATSCPSARSSPPSESHSDPSGTVQTSLPADQKSPPPPPSTSTNHSSLSPKSVTESEEPSEAKDLLELDDRAEDQGSAEGRAPELEKMNQTQNLETGWKKETSEERKKTVEEQKDDDHKNNKALSSVSPQNNPSSTAAEEQRPQKDVPTTKPQVEADRSTRRRSSRRIQDTAIVTEPTTSTISTRSSTRRTSEKIPNDRKVKTTPKKTTPTTRRRLSGGAPDAKDLDVKEEEEKPTPARPRGRPRKRRSPAAGEAEEPEQKRSRPPSPASNFELPPYDPKTPQGQQFVESKWGFFCKLCSVPYLPEAKHCSSKEHYDNLQKYYQTKQTC